MQHFDELHDTWRRLLFDENPLPMALVAADHRFSRCNDSFVRLVGYSRGELLRRTWQSITHPDDIEGDQSGADSLKSDERSDLYTVTKRYLGKSNEVVWVNLYVRAVWDEGKFSCYYVVASPVNQQDHRAAPAVASKPQGIVEWLKANPRDSLLLGGAAVAIFGRDSVIEFIRALLMK